MQSYREGMRLLLKETGITQLKLAEQSKVQQAQVNRILHGKEVGSESTRRRIAEALGTTYDRLLDLGRRSLWSDSSQPPHPPKQLEGLSPQQAAVVEALMRLHPEADIDLINGENGVFWTLDAKQRGFEEGKSYGVLFGGKRSVAKAATLEDEKYLVFDSGLKKAPEPWGGDWLLGKVLSVTTPLD